MHRQSESREACGYGSRAPRGVYPRAGRRPDPLARPRDDSSIRPFGFRFGAQIDGAALADILEMLLEETQRRLAATLFQHLEEIEIRIELRSRRELPER